MSEPSAEAATASPEVDTAVRLGWVVAELRGRSWPDGPRPATSSLPPRPEHTLPLRSQRGYAAAQRSAVNTLAALATQLGVPADDAEASLAEGRSWSEVSTYFFEFDARVQDSLAWRDEAAANGYLLARGLAECYWGLGPDAAWEENGQQTGVSLRFLFGPDRRRELTRMLGRLKGQMHSLSAAAISGSIEAWGKVADDPEWSRVPDLRDQLYEQVRRWYQLLVLDQDPTTLVKPYAKLSSPRGFFRFMRLYRLQILLGIVALLLITAFFAFRGQATSEWIPSIVGVLGVGGAVLTGVLTRAQSSAQRLATRMRQDAYTDLVAVAVTAVPKQPGDQKNGHTIEDAVRRRLLTPATAPPPD